MTVSPDAPPLAFDDLDSAIQVLRETGLRLSTPRRLVLEALFAAEGPVSAVHLARELSIDESSVYRNLDVLEQHGIVRHVHLGHSPGLYVLVTDQEVEYLCCERCSKVTAVAPDRLKLVRDRIKQELGYAARFTHFAIVGICDECAAQPGVSSRGSGEPKTGHEHLHSHGDHVHSHPHSHTGTGQHEH